jgi:chorismate mutase
MKQLDHLREEVDMVDDQILCLLAKRMDIIKQIALEKKNNQLPLFDKDRENMMKKNWINKSKKYNMNHTFIKKIFDEILQMSKNTQDDLIK